MYNGSDLNDQDIANLLYGLAGRRFDRAAWGQLNQNKKEAETYSYGHILTELAPNVCLIIDRVQRNLAEGYFPNAQLTLNGMSILVHKLVSALGDNVVAVKMDAIYTTLQLMNSRLEKD